MQILYYTYDASRIVKMTTCPGEAGGWLVSSVAGAWWLHEVGLDVCSVSLASTCWLAVLHFQTEGEDGPCRSFCARL